MTISEPNAVHRNPSPFHFDLERFWLIARGGTYFVGAALTLRDITSDEYVHLAENATLSIGMKLFAGCSAMPALSQPRASVVPGVSTSNSVTAEFALPREELAGERILLGKIDLVYEGQYWFDHFVKTDAYVAFRNPYLPVESRDIFQYYRSKVIGDLSTDA